MEEKMKEVYFDIFCPLCKFKENGEQDGPCDECLAIPARESSHKPERWEGKI